MGSDDVRKQYALYFNKTLKEKCAAYNYVFFDVYDKYADDNGFLRKELSDNSVHIHDGVHITRFIQENNI